MTRNIVYFLSLIFLFTACKNTQSLAGSSEKTTAATYDFTITFGSCNKHDKPNVFWDDILALQPDIFIWGGDIVYADTDDVEKIKAIYTKQNQITAYAALKSAVPITGTWDDHDYGLNDGGVEFASKKGSQQAFLDFLGVTKEDPRRKQEGVYSSQVLKKPSGTVKIINLDTRYFRSALTDDPREGKRYQPNTYGQGTVLGEAQWKWLEAELNTSKADFNLIISSVQLLSNTHGFEKWANHPHEVDKFKKLITNSGAKSVIVLSGDRHISEFSKTTVAGLDYPLVDFTSSGLTHSYNSFSGEPNPYRVGKVISVPSFGVLKLNIEKRTVLMQISGENGTIFQELKQAY